MNATSPALDGRNVEFMASFNATALFPSGIAGLVEDTALGNVIIDYAPFDDSEVAAPPPDDRPARRAICALDLRLVCEPSDQEWRLTLVSGDRLDRKSVDLLKGLTYRLATMEQSQASPCLEELIATGSARFPQTVPLAMMTGYVVFEAASVGAFTLNLSVEGVALEERRQAALRSLLPDQRSFMEFMRAWLGDGAALEQAKAIDGEVNGTGWTFSGASGGLLEMLIRCAADEPARLKRIDEALSGFGDAELKRLAPESFLKLWRSLIGEHPK
jgi:hypothetical protein